MSYNDISVCANKRYFKGWKAVFWSLIQTYEPGSSHYLIKSRVPLVEKIGKVLNTKYFSKYLEKEVLEEWFGNIINISLST